jgi:sec-independent protein translocase protein TatB
LFAALPLPHYDEAMSFSETIFLFVLALIVFGPKKLPEIARQAGRLLAELRRASNEFRSQIETEIAHLEVEKKQTALTPAEPPAGAVASMSLNPTSLNPADPAVPHESSATLAAPASVAPAEDISPGTPTETDTSPDHAAAENNSEAVADPVSVSASQDSHA